MASLHDTDPNCKNSPAADEIPADVYERLRAHKISASQIDDMKLAGAQDLLRRLEGIPATADDTALNGYTANLQEIEPAADAANESVADATSAQSAGDAPAAPELPPEGERAAAHFAAEDVRRAGARAGGEQHSDTIDFPSLTEPVARFLFGEPTAESTETQLRFGTGRGSLAVETDGPKRGTWYDHADGIGGGVLYLLQHRLGLTARDAIEWLRNNGFIAPRTNGAAARPAWRNIVARYDYNDEEGKLRFQVVRFEPKDFRQRRPDGKGGWEWKRGDRLVPYRLPELLAAIKGGHTVYVAEGEKDVDNLHQIGLVATCNPGGAGKWPGGFAQYFAGVHVVILPDNDDAGRKHAQAVAKNLAPIAASVQVLELPNLPPKGDVSDWLRAGGNAGKLLQLAESAPELTLGRAEAEETERHESGSPAHAVDAEAWQQHLLRTAKGQPRAILANAIIALREAPEWCDLLYFDAFRQRTRLNGMLPWTDRAANRDWTTNDDMLACEWMQHRGILVGPEIIGQAVETVARDSLVHPVLDYLERCEWDGVPRLDTWLTRYLGAEDTAYTRAVGAKWMISAVARVHQPACKVDHCLILEGLQGLHKSTALRLLGGPYFTDEIADLGTKDAALQLAGAWIIELAELDSMSRGDVSRVKAFMSRSTDRFRPPYGRRVIEQPRQCVFAGTVNLNEYLRDETGNRRFWPVKCSEIDVARLAADRDQLWAEAVARYRRDETWWLDDPALAHEAAQEQRARLQADAWEEVIADYLTNKSEVSVSEILHRAVKIAVDGFGNIDIAKVTQADQNRVARCLRSLGWERYQARRPAGRRNWIYRRSPLS